MCVSCKWIRLVAACFIGGISCVHAQGPLTPPGAPGPVMKTLSQVEPRTAITNLPFTINQPGSYYLTGNLSGNQGITIRTNNVTLDLMGFTLEGSSAFAGGISISGAKNVVVRNGGVRDFYVGVGFSAAKGSRVENLIIENNTIAGISLVSGSGTGLDTTDNVIANCIIRGSTYGIELNAYASNAISSTVIERNIISNNAQYGIRLQGAGKIDRNRIVDNTITANGDDGISLNGAGAIDNLVEGNFLSGNSRGLILQAASTNNVVIRNTAVRNTNGNFPSPGANIFGPIVTSTGALSTTNGAPGLSPWANFSL